MKEYSIPVPVKPNDTREGIFKKKFWCHVRYIDTKSIEEIQDYGIPSTWDRARDQDQMNIIVERHLTINEMLDYFLRGQYLAVKNYDDTARIYEYISDHLNKWRMEIENCYDASHAPVKDLIDLDRFAATVHSKARFIFNNEFIESQAKRGFANLFTGIGLGHISMELGMDDASIKRARASSDPHAHLPKHRSLAAAFAARVDMDNLPEEMMDLTDLDLGRVEDHWGDSQ